MLLGDGFSERDLQAMASDLHVPVQQRRGKELHLLATEANALLVAVCCKLSIG